MSKYVYVISNPAFKGWVKVGRATDIKKRMFAMQASVPHIHQFVVEYTAEFPEDVPVHWELEDRKIERSGEWFRCSKHTAIDAVKKVMREYAEFDKRIEDERARAIEDGWI
jgi:hypothetical protein